MRFQHDAGIIIAGPSRSGKTSFVRELLRSREALIDHKIGAIYWCYGIYQPQVHSELEAEGVQLIQGLPAETDFIQPHSILVLDDLVSRTKNSELVTELFTNLAHHRPCLVILVSQNLFEQGKESRTQQLNAQYLIVFKNPRDAAQIRYLGAQMFPHKKKGYLTQVYHEATAQPHGYLVIDSGQNVPDDVRLRSRILPSEAPMIAFAERTKKI